MTCRFHGIAEKWYHRRSNWQWSLTSECRWKCCTQYSSPALSASALHGRQFLEVIQPLIADFHAGAHIAQAHPGERGQGV